MKKQFLAIFAAAALGAGAAHAAGDNSAGSAEIDYGGTGTTRPDYGPGGSGWRGGEAYGNSGWTPDKAYGYDRGWRGHEQRRSSRHYRDRDRDGDGVVDRHDRYPDNRRRS